MTYKVFVSRSLGRNSPFLKSLPSKEYFIFHESLIHFSPTPFDNIPSCDWIFFYSKNAVDFALQNEAFKVIVKEKKIASMGLGTAQQLASHDVQCDFVGNGNPKETAEAFAEKAHKQKVLFPQALQSRQSIQSLLEGQIDTQSLVIYENQMRTDFTIPYCQYLVFTSPLNAVAYYKKYKIRASQKNLAIGNTTAQELKTLGVKNLFVATEPSEACLVELMINL